ncbi:MAG: phosphatase PAP2 family protein [Euryarchaeota archaeon]|jgi:membrane-associated phospholipid phosphatase|nr:phosphatase PAP2 family protein [Euryarchaeota archaeon]MBT3653554.1 phosphatase PAP2 family protein [Euryarchaeota archaeon]MBT3757658.1 phosphatase PAP2 family protein [Euryarchaeota archaeon]MBT4050938.1 phosphatase PAP2 family protein [Euryarchaeota archaeon]MBT4649669.1 phosphatase PAP2 family protein [Euryarchaeota archaeon]
MVSGSGIYLTWITGAIVLTLALMPIFKPNYAKISISGFIDMFRRYWAHMIIVFSIYLWKDLLDQLDRTLMANTHLDLTPYVYAVEGDIVLWVQQASENTLLSIGMTHFYVMGFMTATFASFVFPIYFDDRYMADRVTLSMFFVYILAVPFYLFFNVRVTGDYIPMMDTIAYDLTPEIHNWFSQIDPFTNGMPSLHIGLPFAIWLTYELWDEDNRWIIFRRALVVYIALTGFAILYLGIHWVLDILGGIIIGGIAVQITAKVHRPFWRFADERLFSRRLAHVIDDPIDWLKKSWKIITNSFKPIQKPSTTQTKALIVTLMMLTGTVLLWDATHQSFPIEGVTPSHAAGSEGWVIGVEEPTIGEYQITIWNVSEKVSIIAGGQDWGSIPNVEISGNSLVLFGQNRIDYFELNGTQSVIIEPIFSRFEIIAINDLSVGYSLDGMPYIAYVQNNQIRVIDNREESIIVSISSMDFTIIDAAGSKIAWAIETESGPAVNISSPFNPSLVIQIVIEDFSNEIIDNHLSEIYGIEVDYKHSTIVDLSMDGRYIIAVVDIGPINRVILIDMVTGEQLLLSDPAWPASSPSIAQGQIAFLQIPRFDPNPDVGASSANDVFLHEIALNLTTQITHDEDVNQVQPNVLMNAVAWIEIDEDGISELKIHSLDITFEEYSSIILQSAIVMMIPLLLVWANQITIERKR